MTFRKLMMLAGAGGFVYWHRKNGGQWTLESFKQSGRDLFGRMRGRVDEVAAKAQTAIHDVAGKVVDSTNIGASGFEDPGFRTREDLGYKR